MSLPPMFSMLAGALYNFVDSVFVARVSDAALTAVTVAFPIQMFIIAVMTGTGVGLSSLISRRLGEGNQDAADNAADHGFLLAFLSFIVFALFGLFLVEPFVSLFVHSPAIVPLAVTYIRIVSVGSVFVCFSIVIERIMQGTGNVISPMIFNSVGAILNALLAPVFILGLFGMPRLEVLGAGLVAVFGQMVCCVIAFILFFARRQPVHVSMRKFKFHGKTVKDIYIVGIPTIILVGITSVMISALNMILGRINIYAIAVLGVYFRIQSILFLPVLGMMQGALPIMGYNFGAKNKKRLLSVYKHALVAGMTTTGIGMIVFLILPSQIMGLFNATGDLMHIGVLALREISLGYIFAGLSIVTVSFFQATAHGLAAMMASILRQLVCIIPFAFILSRAFGLDVAWFAFPLAEIFSALYCVLIFRRIYKTEVVRL
jgi:putative MATE family efflux protein